jgi:hypothetical protein
MTPDERALIDGLFGRLNETARALPADQIDPEADRAIRAAAAAQPMAAYLLVQNALVMENAMQAAQARIAELEAAKAPPAPAPARSFLSGVSPWGRRDTVPPSPPSHAQPGYGQPAYGQQPGAAPAQAFGQPAGQPSFLRSALTTAAGVAGGALLFQGISSLMSSHGGGALGSMAQQAQPASQALASDTAASSGSGVQPQTVAYDAPPDDRGYTQASYDAPEESDWGDGGDEA